MHRCDECTIIGREIPRNSAHIHHFACSPWSTDLFFSMGTNPLEGTSLPHCGSDTPEQHPTLIDAKQSVTSSCQVEKFGGQCVLLHSPAGGNVDPVEPVPHGARHRHLDIASKCIVGSREQYSPHFLCCSARIVPMIHSSNTHLPVAPNDRTTCPQSVQTQSCRMLGQTQKRGLDHLRTAVFPYHHDIT